MNSQKFGWSKVRNSPNLKWILKEHLIISYVLKYRLTYINNQDIDAITYPQNFIFYTSGFNDIKQLFVLICKESQRKLSLLCC